MSTSYRMFACFLVAVFSFVGASFGLMAAQQAWRNELLVKDFHSIPAPLPIGWESVICGVLGVIASFLFMRWAK